MKEPIAYILNNLYAIYQAYIENNRKPKATYDALKKGKIPDIESCIKFKTFNSRVKPMMDTYEFLKSDKPIENEKINPEIENLKSDLQVKDNKIIKINNEKVNLIQEIKRLNSVITRLHEDLQETGNNLNQYKPLETQEMTTINEIIQRLERIEKAVFKDKDKPCKEVNQVNLEIDKPINHEKIKIGKWNITQRGNTYRAFRNFGTKGSITGIKAVYIGKTLDTAKERIKEKGYPID